jgi:uncharacterized protein YlxW (UPF0749 family)
MKTGKVVALTIVCLIMGTLVAWQFSSVKANQQIASFEKKNVSELVEDILQERANNEQLQLRIEALQAELEAFDSEERVDQNTMAQLREEVKAARVIAGLETVRGTGLLIELDAEGDRVIEDRHMLELINELRASDVQAMAINDERIVATTEIRKAGRYLMVNGRQLVTPYLVKAIGDPQKMENSLRLLGGIVEKFNLYNFKVTVTPSEDIIVPAVRDDGTVLRTNLMTPVD